MKKIGVMVLTVALVGAMSFTALAGPQGYGRRGPGAGLPQLTEQQRADIQKAHAAFLTATVDIRKKMAENRVEMRTLMAQDNYDQAKFKALTLKAIDLRSQLAKARVEHMGAYAKYMGPGFMSMGARGGMGGPGFRGKRGPGYGSGYCPGGGYGQGQGAGRGYCWR